MRHFNKSQQIVICLLILLLFLATLIKLLPYYRSCFHTNISLQALPFLSNYYIEIIGEIENPGVYRFSEAPTLLEIVLQAGGFKKGLFLEEERDDKDIKNGARIIIKRRSDNIAEISIGMMEPEKLIVLKVPLNINTISQEGLQAIPGIGEGLAKKIVEYRSHNGKFSQLVELTRINGIGKKKFEVIKRYFAPL